MIDLSSRVTPHFFYSEFFRNPADVWAVGYFRQNERMFSARLFELCAYVLEPTRKFFGKSVLILSGIRSPIHNKKEGGASQSQHLYARAADIYIPDVSLRELQAHLRGYTRVGGLALGPGFVHVDTRPRVFGQIVEWRY